MQLAAQLITASLDGDGPLEERMAGLFPWMLALSPEGRAACARALVDAARASFSTGQAHLAVAELTSWRETAAALAAGLHAAPADWLEAAEPVERP